MKICLVERGLLSTRTTGPSKHISQLSQALASSGHDVIVVCEMQNEARSLKQVPSHSGALNPNVVQLGGIGHGHQTILRGIVKLIRDEQPDVVHAQGYRNPTTDMAAFSSQVNDIPFVLSPRGSFSTYLKGETDTMTQVAARMYDLLTLKMTLRRTQSVIATSRSEMQEALDMGLDSGTVHLIPHGMVPPKIPSEKLSLDGQPRLLTVSRITPHRNISDILRSMRLIVKEFPRAILYVAGDPIPTSYDSREKKYMAEIARLANDEHVRNNIRLLGGIYGEQLWRLYASCDAFLYASSYDNFGFALLEAAYFGLPLASTDVGIASDLIRDGAGGILLHDHRPESIADATIKIIRNPNDSKRMSQNVREYAKDYTIEKNVAAHISMYKRLVGHGT